METAFSAAAISKKQAMKTSSRRRRLWDLPIQYHCPVIGVCFDIAEIRKTLAKATQYPAETTDYTWHTLAVGVCESRNPVSEQFNKILDQRYSQAIRKFSAIKTVEELRAKWGETCRSGTDIPATLWAVGTHPACNQDLDQIVLADIHMIQHQVGAGVRHDVQAMASLEQENRNLRTELESARSRIEQLRKNQASSSQALQQQISSLQLELVSATENNLRLQSQVEKFSASIPDYYERSDLLARFTESENRLRRMKENEKRLEGELARLRDFAAHAEKTIEALTANDPTEPLHSPMLDGELQKTLGGKCVLCVGGRTGAIHHYRDTIERHGGHFAHHDGGWEETLHRIEHVIDAADAVICQVACISHNAYWRVKEQCKRTGKPCLFVKKEGSTSFERAVSQLFTTKENRHG